jgi:DNA repair protein RadC
MTHPSPSEEPRIRLVDVRLVGDTESLNQVQHAGHVAELLHKLVGDADRGHFVAVSLDTRHRVTHVHTVSVGHLSGSLVHPREVFEAALLANAAAFVVGHNHPSGDVQQSPEDHLIHERLREAGELLGIELLDAVVSGPGRKFFSQAEGLVRDF